jgi:hypothetical protein
VAERVVLLHNAGCLDKLTPTDETRLLDKTDLNMQVFIDNLFEAEEQYRGPGGLR